MSEEAYQDDIVVSADGITVEKAFKTDEFAVPTVKFTLTSEREDSATVRLSEAIPDDFSMDGIGFHPEYESDNWTAFEDHTVEFEQTIDAGEELITVYGVRIDGPEQAGAFMTEPEIADVTPTGESDEGATEREDEVEDSMIDDIASEESSQAVKDMISGDSDTVPGLEDEDEADEAVEADDSEDEAAEDDDSGLDLGLDDVDLEPDHSDDEDAEEEGDDVPDIDLGIEEGVPEPDEESEEVDLEIEADADLDEDDTEEAEAVEETEDFEDELDEIEAVDEGLETEDEDAEDAEDDLEGVDEEIEETDEDLEDADLEEELDEDVEDTEEVDEDADEVDEAVEDIEDDTEAVGEPADEVVDDETDAIDEPAIDDETPATEPVSAAADAGTDDEATEAVEAGGVASALAAELRAGNVDEEDKAVLREELDVATEDTGVDSSAVARIDHLQSRVEEVAAYTGALETFLEEHGRGDELIEEFEDELASFRADLDGVDQAVTSNAEVIDDLEARLGNEVEEIRETVDGADERIDGVAADLDAVSDDVESVHSDFSEVADRLDDVEGTADETAADLDDLSESLESLGDDLDEVAGDVEEIRNWREQLGEMFS